MLLRIALVAAVLGSAACAPVAPSAADAGTLIVDAGPQTPGELALDLVNAVRFTSGAAPLTRSDTLEQASQAHADYYASQPSAYQHGESPHGETAGLAGFDSDAFDARDTRAGFTGTPFFEVMDFVDDPAAAVPQWLNSLFHRIPLLHPNSTELGYAGANVDGRLVDVMDFGRGPGVVSFTSPPPILYPPLGAVGMPASFAGNETPPPTPPPLGFPSGPIASASFDTGNRVTVAHHQMFDGDGNALGHTLITEDTPDVGQFMVNTVVLYADTPAPAGSTVRVVLDGTAGIDTFTADWSFRVE